MDEQESQLRNRVESKLQQKIIDLEAVRLALGEDIKLSDNEQERARNQDLLTATEGLILQLKLAQANIRALTGDQEGS